MAIDNKLLKIEREAHKLVRLSQITAEAAVKLELNETDYFVRNNAGDIVFQKLDAGRKERKEVNLKASELDELKPDGAPHTVESKSTIEFNEDGTIKVKEASFGNLFPQAEVDQMIQNIETYTDCETIEQMIEDYGKVLEDQVKAAVPEISNLAAINGLLSLPSDPLKILSWARKVVNTFFGPYTMALIDLAVQLAMFTSSLAQLASAAMQARRNLEACAIELYEEANDKILDKIDGTLNRAFGDYDDVMDKLEEAQSAISRVTGKPKRFLPKREGLTLGEGITQNARSKLNPAERKSYEDKRQAERDDLVAQLDSFKELAVSNTAIASFKSDLAAYQAVPLGQDPNTGGDLASAASAMGAALGLPPLGTAVPGTVQITTSDATFTFQNGVMVQATGTNSDTGIGISTASVTSLPSTYAFIGTEWDGTIPAHVELITRLDGYGSPIIGSLPHGDVGPFGNPPVATEYTKKWPIPNDLKILSAKFNLRNDRAGFGSGAFQFTSGATDQSQWRNAGTVNTALIYWFSATPGGAPMTDVHGNPVVKGGAIETDIRFVQGYDASLVSGGGMIGVKGTFGTRDVFESHWKTGKTFVPITERVDGQIYNKLGEEPTASYEPLYADTGQDRHVMFPIITKTYFFNTALVEATAGDTYVATGTIPGASDLVQYIPSEAKTGADYQAHLDNVSNQCRVMRATISGDVDLPLSSPPLSEIEENRTEVVFEGSNVSGAPNDRPYRLGVGGFLEETNLRTDSANNLYIAYDGATRDSRGLYSPTENNMDSFIGATWDGTFANTTQLITNWKYTDGTDVLSAAGRANTDIGFASETPLLFGSSSAITTPSSSSIKPRKYPIPTNGKISTSEFSFGWASYRTGLTFKPDGRFSQYHAAIWRDTQRSGAEANFDRQYASKFNMEWTLPADNLSHAWYDLGLMPVAWMSDVPGGSPRTLVDGTSGLVVKLDQTGGLYKAQTLSDDTGLFSTAASGMGRTGNRTVIDAEAATFPIVQKTFFLNVAVVSANTATSLVASGTAPTANQLISWSVSDPALGYTGTNDQHLTFTLLQRTFSNNGELDDIVFKETAPDAQNKQHYFNITPFVEIAPGALPGSSPPDSVWPKGFDYTP